MNKKIIMQDKMGREIEIDYDYPISVNQNGVQIIIFNAEPNKNGNKFGQSIILTKEQFKQIQNYEID